MLNDFRCYGFEVLAFLKFESAVFINILADLWKDKAKIF